MSTNGKVKSLQQSMFPEVLPTADSGRKQEGQTVIAHISDLHFTSSTDYNAAPWKTLLNDLVDEGRGGIDLLIVTGDLIDSPLTRLHKKVSAFFTRKDEIKLAFEQVHKYLLELCEKLKINPNHGLFVVPGNHDYRISGIHKSRTQPVRFREQFENFCRPLILPNLNLCVFVLDSNVMEFLDLASARVGDLEQFYRMASLIPDENARFTRISLLHHHPMPIAATEKPGFFNNPGYTMLKNAGQFMSTMVAAEIDLILHGHEHHPAYSKAVYPYGKNHEHLITVISAGSVGRGVCNYNLVTITDNGQIHLERRSLENGAVYDYDYDKQLRDYEDARRVRFDAYARTVKAKLKIEKSSRLYVIIDDSGDAELHQYDENVSAYDEEVKEVETYLVSEAGFFFTPEYDNPRINWTWKPPKGTDTNRREAIITFTPPLTKNDRENSYRYSKVFNLLQFNQQDLLDVSKGKLDREAYETTIGNVFDVLTVQIQFPKSKFPREFSYRVLDPNKRLDRFELAYFAKRVSTLKETSTIVFTLEKPLPGYKYTITWPLPPLEEDELNLSGTNKAHADDVVTNLLSSQTTSPHNQTVRNWIDELRRNIVDSQAWQELEGNDDLEISLYVYDRNQGGLVSVATSPATTQFPIPPNDVIKPGKTLIGEAFRRRGPAFYNTLSGHIFNTAEYGDRIPPGWGSLAEKRYVAVCAIPLFYPLLRGRRVAVLSLASASNGSRLLPLMPDQNDDAKQKKEKKIRQKSLTENVTGTQFGRMISKLGVPVIVAQKKSES